MLKRVVIFLTAILIGSVIILVTLFSPKAYDPEYRLDLPTINGVPSIVLTMGAEGFPLNDIQGIYHLDEFPGYFADGYWLPTNEDLKAFEYKLEQHLQKFPPSWGELNLKPLPISVCQYKVSDLNKDLLRNSVRQYAAIKIHEKRYLYVMAVNREAYESALTRRSVEEPVSLVQGLEFYLLRMVDSGPTTFTALYDVHNDQMIDVIHDSFFGSIC